MSGLTLPGTKTIELNPLGITPENPIKTAKNIAIIKIFGGAITLYISDDCNFTPPTEEQRKNLKEMLCIDVELLEDE